MFSLNFNPELSNNSIKGFLLKEHFQDPRIRKEETQYKQKIREKIEKNIDDFMENVIIKMKINNIPFDCNKITWYYKVYREGHDVLEFAKSSFQFDLVNENKIKDFINEIINKSESEMIEFFNKKRNYILRSSNIIAEWFNIQLMKERYDYVFKDLDVLNWFDKLNEHCKNRKNIQDNNLKQFLQLEENWNQVKNKLNPLLQAKL